MKKKAGNKPLTLSTKRRAIGSGAMGEQVAAVAPATVPMEADAEAGGISTASQPRKESPVRQPTTDGNAASFGSAMRQSDWDRRESRGPKKWALSAIIGVIAIVAVILVAMTWLG